MDDTNLFNYQDRYPNVPGCRHTDTSKAAGEAVKDRAPTIRDQILSLLKRNNLTPDEAAKILGVSILAARPRFSELSRLGKIFRTGELRKNESGVNADVWSSY